MNIFFENKLLFICTHKINVLYLHTETKNSNNPFKFTDMEKEKLYQITGTTNGWIANHDPRFNGKTCITICQDLTLEGAYKKLLDFFNEDYSKELLNADSWDEAVNISNGMAQPTFSDGTRMYEYDSRYYRIEEQEEPKPIEYTVTDNETGNCEIYRGDSLSSAIQIVRDEFDLNEWDWKDNTAWDIIANGETIFNGCIDSMSDLDKLDKSND